MLFISVSLHLSSVSKVMRIQIVFGRGSHVRVRMFVVQYQGLCSRLNAVVCLILAMSSMVLVLLRYSSSLKWL